MYRMVMNPTAPSYRHHVDQGLTTLPEFWNYTELWNGLGRSRNHAMMGHVKEWLCRFVLGITPVEPGYGRVRIRPWLNEEISRVKGAVFLSLIHIYGISSGKAAIPTGICCGICG